MKAIAITPGSTSVHLIDRTEPQIVDDDDVKLQVLRVGICGTDREEVSGGRSDAPTGQHQLVIGHEMLGKVVQIGSKVKKVAIDDYAVLSVRRGCGHCLACQLNRSDMCYSGDYTERGIKGADGFQAEYVVDKEQYVVKVPSEIADLGVLTEPMSVIEKAIDEAVKIQFARLPGLTHPVEAIRNKVALVAGLGPIGLLATVALRLRGAKVIGLDIIDEDSPRAQLLTKLGGIYVDGRHVHADALDDHFGQIDFILEASGVAMLEFNLIDALGINGIYVVTGIPGGDRTIDIAGAALMRQMVLDNQVLLGSVNASPGHFQMAVDDLKKAYKQWPHVMSQLITRRVPFVQFNDALTNHSNNDIKVVVEWSGNGAGNGSGIGSGIGATGEFATNQSADPETAHQAVPKIDVPSNKPPLAVLVASLHDPDEGVRESAMRTLCSSLEPAALQVVIRAMVDDDPGVRWLAAEGLIGIGESGIKPLLYALMSQSGSVWMRQSAIHVLHAYVKSPWGRQLTPILDALVDVQPALTVPPLAQKALYSLLSVA